MEQIGTAEMAALGLSKASPSAGLPRRSDTSKRFYRLIMDAMAVSKRGVDMAIMADAWPRFAKLLGEWAEQDAGGGTTAAGSFAPDADGWRGTRTLRLRWADYVRSRLGWAAGDFIASETETAANLDAHHG